MVPTLQGQSRHDQRMKPAPCRIQVLCIDDRPIVRQGVATPLSVEPDLILMDGVMPAMALSGCWTSSYIASRLSSPEHRKLSPDCPLAVERCPNRP